LTEKVVALEKLTMFEMVLSDRLCEREAKMVSSEQTATEP
jgi:hypothetical protein